MAARNMYRIEINIHEKLCVKLVIYKDHTRMHGQQNKSQSRHLLLGGVLVVFLSFRAKFCQIFSRP